MQKQQNQMKLKSKISLISTLSFILLIALIPFAAQAIVYDSSPDCEQKMNTYYYLQSLSLTGRSYGLPGELFSTSFYGMPPAPCYQPSSTESTESSAPVVTTVSVSPSYTGRSYHSTTEVFAPYGSKISPSTSVPADFKIAFIGDVGDSINSSKVMKLIKSEGADVILISGDFDYKHNPSRFDRFLTSYFGEDFPIFASIGNHDADAWSGYKRRFERRLKRIDGAQCTGDYGVKSICTYNGISFILSGVGTKGSNHEEYLEGALTSAETDWKICSWHKVMQKLQAGNNADSTGYGVYDECRKHGAIIITAHEHSYSRTHLMDNFETQSIASTDNTLTLEDGKSFAVVSGLGGRSHRNLNTTRAAYPWMAAAYGMNSPGTYGAFFCSFNVDGDEDKASCYFKDINGIIQDSFTVINKA